MIPLKAWGEAWLLHPLRAGRGGTDGGHLPRQPAPVPCGSGPIGAIYLPALFSPWRQSLEKAVANSFKSSRLLTVLFFICMLLLKLVHACVEQKSFISTEDGVA